MQQEKHQSFETIIERNKSSIYRICSIYAVNPITPEDLFQEVVFQIWKSLNSFQGKSNISTWIYRIALNVCLSAQKKLNAKNEKTIRLEAIQFATEVPATNKIEDEKYQALQRCIATLSSIDASIVILFLEGVRYKEIAGITGLSENHVAVKMKRIKKQLLQCITTKLN